ncbi:MAG: hypothetical protein ABIC68_03635 [Candidatus Omnitrophota bacterium]
MRIITVSGTHSGVGKTTFVEELLGQLKGWSCLKVTFMHKGLSCPIHKNCGACDKLDSAFYIVADEKTLLQQDKDTYRFKRAGAKQVFWLKAQTEEGLKQGWQKAVDMFDGSKGLIVEGTSVLKYLHPDLAVFIIGKDKPWKESAKEIFEGGFLQEKPYFFSSSDMPFLHNDTVLCLALRGLENEGEHDGSKV